MHTTGIMESLALLQNWLRVKQLLRWCIKPSYLSTDLINSQQVKLVLSY